MVDGKLDIGGGFLRAYQVSVDRLVDVHLIVLARFEAGESTPKLSIELVMPSGDSQTMSVDMPWAPDESDEEDLGFAFWPLLIPAEDDGLYRLIIGGGEDSLTLPLRVMSR